MAVSESTARLSIPPDEGVADATREHPRSLHAVIAEAIDTARSQGLDERQQYCYAVNAGMRVEADLNLLAAARLINRILESQDQFGYPSDPSPGCDRVPKAEMAKPARGAIRPLRLLE